MTIRDIAFVTPGNYAEDDPGAGLEAALLLFQKGEALGFDSAWVRSRHLERGISSAATFLAAASQRRGYPVIPGRRKATNPESPSNQPISRFRVHAFGVPRNDSL